MNHINLETYANGAVTEQVNKAIEKVAENIQDRSRRRCLEICSHASDCGFPFRQSEGAGCFRNDYNYRINIW